MLPYLYIFYIENVIDFIYKIYFNKFSIENLFQKIFYITDIPNQVVSKSYFLNVFLFFFPLFWGLFSIGLFRCALYLFRSL